MKQIETLQLIRARCVELLEQSKLRAPGAWHMANGTAYMVLRAPDGELDRVNTICTTNNPNDTTYIANASVAFEAALESTIAAIDGADEIMLHYSSAEHNTLLHALVEEQRNDIIAAWKHLLP